MRNYLFKSVENSLDFLQHLLYIIAYETKYDYIVIKIYYIELKTLTSDLNKAFVYQKKYRPGDTDSE